jgi:hypothetical protein
MKQHDLNGQTAGGMLTSPNVFVTSKQRPEEWYKTSIKIIKFEKPQGVEGDKPQTFKLRRTIKANANMRRTDNRLTKV